MINDFLKTLLFFSIILPGSTFLPVIQGSERKLSHQRNRSRSAPHPLCSIIASQSSFLTASLTNEIKVCNFRFSEQLENYDIVKEILEEISKKPSSIFLLQNLKSPKDFQDLLKEKNSQDIALLTQAPLKKTVPSPLPESFFNGLLYNTTQFKVEDVPFKYYAYPGKNEGIGLFCVNGYPQKYRMIAKLFTHISTKHQIAICNMDLQPSLKDDIAHLDQAIAVTIDAIQKGYETPSIILGGNFNRPLTLKSFKKALINPSLDIKNPHNYSQTALLTVNHFLKYLLEQRISPNISCVVNKLFEEGKLLEEELWQLSQVNDKSQPIKLAEIQSSKKPHEDNAY